MAIKLDSASLSDTLNKILINVLTTPPPNKFNKKKTIKIKCSVYIYIHKVTSCSVLRCSALENKHKTFDIDYNTAIYSDSRSFE